MASVGAVGRGFLTTASKQKYEATTYFEAINKKFTKLRMQVADFRSTEQYNKLTTKVNVLLSEEILAGASADEALASRLEKRLKELPEVAKALTDRFEKDSSQKLTAVGFTVDKRGNILCRGTVRKTGSKEDVGFDIKLGNLKEKSMSLLSRLEREFDTQAFRLNLFV